MRVLAVVGLLLGGCAPEPYCDSGELDARCGEDYGAFCAGGYDQAEPGRWLPGTELARCDDDSVPFCENGGDPYCERDPFVP